jgi:ASCH domain
MLRALSIRQPWAWAVAAGHKSIENRTWTTSYRGPFAIHAARVVETEAFADVERLTGQPVPGGLALGAVVAVCHLIDVVTQSDDVWFSGPYGWVLADMLPICPVQCVGQQRLFELPHDVEQAVRHQIRKRTAA